jgi:peptidoglycan/LPS O-acetylase OafA/YrhL
MNISQRSEVGRPWWQPRANIILCAFLAIAAFFLITEHTAHFFGLLPYALLLLCPLLHLFLHGAHGRHGSQTDHSQPMAEKPQPWQGEKS